MMATETVQTVESQKAMSPAEGRQRLKDGNARFVKGLTTSCDYLDQAKAAANG